MTRREQFVLVFAIWACVYPGVLLFDYGFEWAGIDWPPYITIAISTSFTVPFISLVISPRIEKLLAKARDKTLADYKRDQAKAVEQAND